MRCSYNIFVLLWEFTLMQVERFWFQEFAQLVFVSVITVIVIRILLDEWNDTVYQPDTLTL